MEKVSKSTIARLVAEVTNAKLTEPNYNKQFELVDVINSGMFTDREALAAIILERFSSLEKPNSSESLKNQFFDFVQFFGHAFHNAKDLDFNSFYISLKIKGIPFGPKRDEVWLPDGYEAKQQNTLAEYEAPQGKITTQNLYFKINHLNHSKDLFDEMIAQLTFGEEKNESIKELHFRCQELQSEIAVFLEEQGDKCPQNIADQLKQINENIEKSTRKYEAILNNPHILKHKKPAKKPIERKVQSLDSQVSRLEKEVPKKPLFEDDEDDDPLDAILNRKRPQPSQQQTSQPQTPSNITSPPSQPNSNTLNLLMTPPQSNQQPLTQPNLLQPMVPQTQPLPDLTSQQPFIQPQATQPTLIQPLIPQSNQISNPPLTQFFPNLQQPMQPQTLQPQMLFPNAQPQQLFPTMQPLISALPQPQVLQPQILQPQQSSQTQQQQQFALF